MRLHEDLIKNFKNNKEYSKASLKASVIYIFCK